jgi:hypothetical protein
MAGTDIGRTEESLPEIVVQDQALWEWLPDAIRFRLPAAWDATYELRTGTTVCNSARELTFALSYQQRFHAWSERRTWRRSERIRWAAALSVLLAPAAIWWFGNVAFLAPTISAFLLALAGFEPYRAHSGWHYIYRHRLRELQLKVRSDEQVLEIEQLRTKLGREMGEIFPHWEIPIGFADQVARGRTRRAKDKNDEGGGEPPDG